MHQTLRLLWPVGHYVKNYPHYNNHKLIGSSLGKLAFKRGAPAFNRKLPVIENGLDNFSIVLNTVAAF